jgi:hypothetical protein
MSTIRIRPVLSQSEPGLVEQMAALTRTKRMEVIKNALAVYYWYVRQAVTGARVVARKPSGEEVTLQTPKLAALEAQANLLSPRELRLLAKKLSTTRDAGEAALLKERLTRGFYGI